MARVMVVVFVLLKSPARHGQGMQHLRALEWLRAKSTACTAARVTATAAAAIVAVGVILLILVACRVACCVACC